MLGVCASLVADKSYLITGLVISAECQVFFPLLAAFCSMVMVKRLQFQRNRLTQSMTSLVHRLIPPSPPRIRDRLQFPVDTNTTKFVAKTLESCPQDR